MEKLPVLDVYTDGSYIPSTGEGGAGIYFPFLSDEASEKKSQPQQPDNTKKPFAFALPVPPPVTPPCSKDARMDAVRAEIYAVVAAVHIVQYQFLQPLDQIQLAFHLDSLIALNLLKFVLEPFPTCPSRTMKHFEEKGFELQVNFKWEGGVLTASELWKYTDLLDIFWAYTRNVPASCFTFCKVKAHTIDSSEGAGASPATSAAGGPLQPSDASIYNDEADRLSKEGSRTTSSVRSQANIVRLANEGFPIFQHWARSYAS